MNDSLRIEKLVAGGYGLARTAHGVALVAGAIEGELLEGERIGARGDIPLFAAARILEPSPHRRTPPCELATTCGGCDWQHLDYQAQLSAKKGIFLESMRRVGKIKDDPSLELFSSPQWRYRSRAQFKIDRDAQVMGFFRRGTNEVVQTRQCPLLAPCLDELLRDQEAILAALPRNAAQLRAIAGDAGRIASSPVAPHHTFAHTRITVAGRTCHVPGDAFFQSNAPLLETLGRWGEPMASGDFFVDLFGGLGFFSLMLGHRFKKGLLVEQHPVQVKHARANFAANGISGMEALATQAERFFAREASRYPRPDCVIIDPPRPGLTRAARQGVRDMAPKTILSISCNPVTHARDLGFFTGNGVYRIVKTALFDLYPQTHHMETAAFLERTIP